MIPPPSALLLFISAPLLLFIIPGPAVLYIVGRSIGHGRGAGLVSAIGISVGSLVHTAAAAVGLSALLMSSAMAFSIVKYLGVAYLIYLGIQKLCREGPFELSGDRSRVRFSRIFAQCVVNVLNPKAALLFFAFLPQFVDPARGNVTPQILFLGVLFAILGVTTDTFWALTSGTGAGLFRRSPRAMRTQCFVSGTILISLGVATALTDPNKK
jgi:threonine/homoserine/homoserine lactone efflux protein